MQRRIATQGISKEAENRAQTIRNPHRVAQIAQFSGASQSGTVVASYDIGPTYRNSMLSIISDVEIAGKTVEMNGRHYVTRAAWPDYVETVDVRLNNRILQTHSIDELLERQSYRGFDEVDGFVMVTFGGPRMFEDEKEEDALALGTKGLNAFALHIKLTGAFAEGTMRFESWEDFVAVARPTGFVFSNLRQYYEATGAGKLAIHEIPINKAIAGLHFKSDKIDRVTIKVGDSILFDDVPVPALNAFERMFAHDHAAMSGVYINFHRDKRLQKTIAALMSEQNRKQNDKFVVELQLC